MISYQFKLLLMYRMLLESIPSEMINLKLPNDFSQLYQQKEK